MRGQRERAWTIYGQALEAYQRINDERGIVDTLHNLAVSQRDAGRSDDTLRAWDRAVDAAERLGAGGPIALTLLGRAEQLIEGGAFERATADIDRAQLLAWMEGNEPHVLESERLRALLSLRRGQPENAHRHAEVIRARASRSGCAWIAAESAAIAALALKADRRPPRPPRRTTSPWPSLVALGATGRLEIMRAPGGKPRA
jgi:tetratricopeptide (TPR) repeat protein